MPAERVASAAHVSEHEIGDCGDEHDCEPKVQRFVESALDPNGHERGGAKCNAAPNDGNADGGGALASITRALYRGRDSTRRVGSCQRAEDEQSVRRGRRDRHTEASAGLRRYTPEVPTRQATYSQVTVCSLPKNGAGSSAPG